MKRELILIIFLVSCCFPLKSQQKYNSTIPKIGDDAAQFRANTTQGTLDFPNDYGNQLKVLYSNPHDFAPVCSSEILQLAKMQNEFAKPGTNLVIISTDFLESHFEGTKELESIKNGNFEPVEINYPLVTDDYFVISKSTG
jgi:peroxiredoxin (alkyl hydroperoxide reductase subunit C)